MNDLSDKMKERLEKWRKNTLAVPSVEKVREKTSVYLARREYGDEYSEEAMLQEQRNRSANEQRRSR